jgi:serine/threonine protein kinase
MKHKLPLKIASLGNMNICTVLRRVRRKDGVWCWETTDRIVAVKLSAFSPRSKHQQHFDGSKAKVAASASRLFNSDPLKEAAVLQFLGSYHSNILGCLDVLRDRDRLYTVMPWCEGGDLYGRFIGRGSNSSKSSKVMSEDEARVMFGQLLSGISHLQNKGVCHRNLSLENLVIDSKGHLKIIDFGMALRVPYSDAKNFNSITDVSEGSTRRLISRKYHQDGGNLTYLAPEILEQADFDGLAVDLWAAGIILFCWLVGATPFRFAHSSDLRFARISTGYLREMIRGLDINISDDACDLVQRMLYGDPAKRLSLSQIQNHVWVSTGAPVAAPSELIEPKVDDECFNSAASTPAHFLGSAELPPKHSPLRALMTT